MRRATILATSVLAFAPGAAPARPAPAPPANPYVVVFDDGAVPDGGARVHTLQLALCFTSKLRYSSALDGFAADLTDAQAAQLAATPGVAFVHPDTTISMAGTSTLAAGETVPAGIRR